MKTFLLLLTLPLAATAAIPIDRPATPDNPATGVLLTSTGAEKLATTIRTVEEMRLQATLHADVSTLDALLRHDCLYVHSNGRVQTKAGFLEAVKSGAIKYTALRYLEPPQVRACGVDAAVLTGRLQVEATSKAMGPLQSTLLVTLVYVHLLDRWELVSYQSTNAAK